MSPTRSVMLSAIVTITMIIALVVLHLSRGFVATGMAMVLEQEISSEYTVFVIAGQGAWVLPMLAAIGVHLSATALVRSSQRRTALVPVLVNAAVIPVLNILSGAVLWFVPSGTSSGSGLGRLTDLLDVLEAGAILLGGLLGIAAVIIVWVRGSAGGALVPRRANVLPKLVVIAAILLVLAQTMLAVFQMPSEDSGSGVAAASRFLASTLPQWFVGAALMTLVTLMVAASAPAGRASAWIAAITASTIPVAQLIVSIPAILLLSSEEIDRGHLALTTSAIPVQLLAAAIIIVFTLRSASRSRVTSPHPDHLPR